MPNDWSPFRNDGSEGDQGWNKKYQEPSNRQKCHAHGVGNTNERDPIPKSHTVIGPTSNPIHCFERSLSNPLYWRHAVHRREDGNKGVPCGA